MTDRRRSTTASEAEARLVRLAAHLAAHRLEVDLTANGLVVSEPETTANCSGAAPENQRIWDTITCRQRDVDGGCLWFFDSAGEPITEADYVVDAVVVIVGRRAGVS